MSVIKESHYDQRPDKNLQDDWLPDQQRRAGATSCELPEFGGDLKRKDTVTSIEEAINRNSQKDQKRRLHEQ